MFLSRAFIWMVTSLDFVTRQWDFFSKMNIENFHLSGDTFWCWIAFGVKRWILTGILKKYRLAIIILARVKRSLNWSEIFIFCPENTFCSQVALLVLSTNKKWKTRQLLSPSYCKNNQIVVVSPAKPSERDG